jgi:polysaccharide export outer membrane protein
MQHLRDGQVADPVIYGNDTIVVEKSKGKMLLQTLIGVLPVFNAFRTIDSLDRL